MRKENKTGLQKISIILGLLILFNLLFIPGILAQDVNPGSPESIAKVKLNVSLTPTYVIGPGDQLTITDRTLRDIAGGVEKYDSVVSSDGYISVPLPDGTQQNLLAAGYTLDELSNEVRTLFGKTLKHPLVFVQITRYRPINIYIGGEVEKPGIYKVETTTTQTEGGKSSTSSSNSFGLSLTQVIQLAGGLKPRADIRSITVTRGSASEKKMIDLKTLITGENILQDINLQPGDAIFVTTTDKLGDQAQGNVLLLGKLAYQDVPVSVVGEAKSTGNFVLPNDATLLDAIGKAGGLNGVGTLKKIKLSRYDDNGVYMSQELNVHEMLRKGIGFDQISLRPNDTIEIEASKGKETRRFFRETGNALVTTVGNQVGSFILQDHLFRRISHQSKGLLGNSSPFNNGTGGSISIISTPPIGGP